MNAAPTQKTIDTFLAATENGRTVKVTTSGLSRGTLERLVAVGIAKRVETIGHGWSEDSIMAAQHRPSSVRYARA